MRLLLKLLGLGLILLSVYLLGQNIIFTSNVYPYWWRGIAADASVLALIVGIFMLFFVRRTYTNWGWGFIALGIALVFLSSRVVLSPTSLWQFFLSGISFAAGYRLITTGRLRF